MVSTRRGTSGVNPLSPPPEDNHPRETEHTQSLHLTPDPNPTGSVPAPQPVVTLTLAELQKFMIDWQKQAYTEARADFQARDAEMPPDARAPMPQVRAPMPAARAPSVNITPFQSQPPRDPQAQDLPRREGPTESTGHTRRPPSADQRAAHGVPSGIETRIPPIRPPVEEGVAESTCRGDRGARPPFREHLPREQEEPVYVPPDLQEFSQQVLHLSKKVEDMIRGQTRPACHGAHQQQVPRTIPLGAPQRLKRERESPFCDEIVMERIVGNSAIPTMLPRYDGTTDPMQHILKFEHLMALHGHGSNIHAKVLVTTFQDLALEWFTRLEARSISSYEQLVNKFLHQFASRRRARMPHTNLYSVKQAERESTRDFVERFNNEVLKVEAPTVDFLVDVLYFGLRNKALAGALAREKPKTMERLLAITNSYIEEEEMSKLKYGNREQKQKGKERELVHSRDGRRSPIKRFQAYTTLNTTRKEVFLAIQNDGILRTPKKLRESPHTLASDKYCLYHKQKGHDTEDCMTLLDEIERLIRNGGLRKFLGKDRRGKQKEKIGEPENRERSRSPRRDRNHPTRGVIDMIAGGPTGGDSKSSRRKTEKVLKHAAGSSRSELLHVSTAYDGSISFNAQDAEHIPSTMLPNRTDCPMVLKADISNFSVRKILVDNGSSVNIIFRSTLEKMQLGQVQLKQVRTPLIGFGGSETFPLGTLALATSLGEEPMRRTLMIEYLVVDATFAYNAILGRPALSDFQAIISTYHQKLKFPTPFGVGEAVCDLKEAWKCYMVSLDNRPPTRSNPVRKVGAEVDLNDLIDGGSRKRAHDETRVEPMEGYKVIELIPGDSARTTKIGGNLNKNAECLLIEFLRNNKDVFAWKASELEGVDPAVICHKLNVDPNFRPVRQKERTFGGDRNQIISEEVDKLLEAGYVREIMYTDWLCNVVLVPKSGGKWRMCNDFTDLNKACPKDPYPLPRIDQLVDSTAGSQMLSMMDAFQGYYQISLAPEDQEKTSFIVKKGIYCFLVMPFGLKNAGATYQRLVNLMFREQIGRNIEVYVDDMIVKSTLEEDHLSDLAETFGILRKYGMKLNPTKCTFGVRGGKFLGFMVSQRGIEANPEKIQAVQNVAPPKTVKDVQRLVGRVVALNRFISRLADKSLPFFKALRNNKKFEWTPECEKALIELKKYLQSPPLLVKPRPQERLGLYLAISHDALSSVLVSLVDQHRPIYYISRAIQGAERNYPEIEVFALALVHSARRLRPYFQSHSITVLTDQPLKQVLSKPSASGRLIKWSVELSEFDLDFKPRSAIKAQVLAEFLLEVPTVESQGQEQSPWTISVDGSSLGSKGGAGIHLMSPEGIEMSFSVSLNFPVTNNEAEYEALLLGIQMAQESGARSLVALTDSQLVVNQFTGVYETREEPLQQYLAEVKKLSNGLSSFSLQQVPRTENARADALSKMAHAIPSSENGTIHLLHRNQPGIQRKVYLLKIDAKDWRYEISQYLQDGKLPSERNQARRVKIRAARYRLTSHGELLRSSLEGVTLKCLGPESALSVLEEIHQGVCGNHTSGRVLAHKVQRAGYFWPTLLKDSIEFVKKCSACQFNANIPHRPANEMKPIGSTWPFEQWGIDLVGPFPPASGQRKFLVVAIEYFTKWVEAEALAKISDSTVWSFIWKNVICRFGIPRIIISDNGTQFQNKYMKERCEELGIRQHFTSVGRPQANGQTEVTNRTIVAHLKTRLGKRKGTWADDLPAVLWSYRTTPRSTTEDTPFSLVYGSDAVLPVERLEESVRCLYFDQEQNEGQRLLDLDLLEERRLQALTKTQLYQAKIKRAYDLRIKPREFQKGDWVLKKVSVSKHVGKLDPSWDGPYKIIQVAGHNTYMLADQDGFELPRPWNATNLKKFYV